MAQNISETFQMVLLPSVYSAEFTLALTGNLFALWLLVVREKRNWHPGVILSCNLAISDLLYVLTLPLLIVYYSLKKNWIFGDSACKIERFLFTCNLYVSIYFVMAISVNRCVALTCPFFSRSYVGPVHAKVISVIIWIIVGVMSCPELTFASVCPQNNSKIECVSFCDDKLKNSHFTYKMFLAVFGFFVPFVVTFTSYCMVIRVVWKNVSITTLEKRKIALLVISTLVLYALIIPYQSLQILHLYRRKQGLPKSGLLFTMYQVSKGVASLNMCIDPILYMALFDSIRVVCCGKCSEDKKPQTEAQVKFDTRNR